MKYGLGKAVAVEPPPPRQDTPPPPPRPATVAALHVSGSLRAQPPPLGTHTACLNPKIEPLTPTPHTPPPLLFLQ